MAIDPQAGARQAGAGEPARAGRPGPRAGEPAGASEPESEVVQRYNSRTRWFHAGVYLTVLPLLATGWWLLLGQEGDPSPLARVIDLPDTTLHRRIGWALLGVAALGLVLGVRAVGTFVVETVRFRRSDLAWFARWPRAVVSGRFGWHNGHFDPGQRIANVVITLGLAAVVGSGVGIAMLHGGPAFVWLVRVHRWSTYLLTPVLLGHILITFLPPGYRGAWRSMHLGGRLSTQVARRLWPGWLERQRRARSH
jgi:cytochrome b subunit of formate dehydrogenase